MNTKSRARKMVLLVVSFLTLAVPCVAARQPIKRCAVLEVRSLKVSLKLVQNMPLDAQQETIEASDAGAQTQDIAVVARGPVLGSMDSEAVKTGLACSSDGLVLSATITRSANYHGAALQNILWFPQITVVVQPLTPKMVFKTIWRMRLTNGKTVERSRTPPFPGRTYPITVTKKLEKKKK